MEQAQNQQQQQQFLFQLFENPKLKDIFSRGNKQMKKADLYLKYKGTTYGLISDFVAGFSKLVSELTIQDSVELEVSEQSFNVNVFEEVVKLFFGFSICIEPYDIFAFLKVIDYFGIGQSPGSKAESETLHEQILKFASKQIDRLNFFEAWDYASMILSENSEVENFTIRKSQIKESVAEFNKGLIEYMKRKEFDLSETYEIVKSPEKQTATLQHQLSPKKSQQTIISTGGGNGSTGGGNDRSNFIKFTANDMHMDSYIALKEVFLQFYPQGQGKNRTQQRPVVQQMFEALDRHFGVVGTSQIQEEEFTEKLTNIMNAKLEKAKIQQDEEIKLIKEQNGIIVKQLKDKITELKNELKATKKKFESLYFNQIKATCIIDKDQLVLAFKNCTIEIIDIVSCETVSIIIGEFEMEPLCICIFPIQGMVHIVTGMSDGSLILWNRQKSSKSFVLDKTDFFSPAIGVLNYEDQLIISSHQDGSLLFWRPSEKPALVFDYQLQKQQAFSSIYTHANFGEQLITGSIDGQIKLWQITNSQLNLDMEQRHKLKSHTQGITCFAHIDSQPEQLVSAGFDKVIIIWNWSNETVVHTIKLEYVVKSLLAPSFEKTRQLLLLGSEQGQIALYNIEKAPAVLKDLTQQGVSSIKALLPHRFSNTIIAITSRSSDILSYNINFGKDGSTQLIRQGEMQITHVDNLEGHQSCVYALCPLVVDPQFVASGSDDKTIKVWDINSGACVATMEGHQAYVRVLCVLQDPERIVSASYDTTIKVWKYQQRTCERTLTGHSGPVLALAVNNNSENLLASGGEDSLIKLWNWKDGTCTLTINTTKNEVWSMSSFNAYFASGHRDGLIKIYKWKEGGQFDKDLRGHKSYVNAILQLEDEDLIISASSDHLIIIWNWSFGLMVRSLKGHADIVWDLTILNDPRYIVSSSTDGKIKIWFWKDGNCLGTYQGSPGSIYAVANVRKQSKLISGAGDNAIKLWSYGRASSGFLIKSKVMANCSQSTSAQI